MNTNMTEFKCFAKIFASLCFGLSIKSVPLEIVVWIYDTFDNNLGIENDFTKYLKRSCR